MFLDASLSAIGRATEVQLNTLRRKLGAGCDPCFDYSAQPLTEKVQQDDGDDLSLARFLDLLKRVNSEPAEETENKVPEDTPPLGNDLRKKYEEKRPSSAFKNSSREALQRLEARTNQGPPVGSYSPKADCLASFGKVKHPTPKVPDFRAYVGNHLSLSMDGSAPNTQRNLGSNSGDNCCEPSGIETDDLGQMEIRSRQFTFVNMAKQIPRPPLLNNLPPHDPQALDPEGVLYGHLKCARFGRFYRQPCFEFGKLPRQEAIAAAGGSSPGEYEVKFDIAKPASTCHSFSNIPRPEFAGSHRITDHLPDRSLARDCRSLTRFGRLLSPPVSVPRFDRPAQPVRPKSGLSMSNSRESKHPVPSQSEPDLAGSQWAWPTRQAPRSLGISVSHERSESTCRPRSAIQRPPRW